MAEPHITRRGMLGATAVLPLLAASPSVASYAALQLGNPVLAAAARWDRHQAAFVPFDVDEAKHARWLERDYELFEEAATLPAGTAAGLAAKLRLAEDYTGTDWPVEIMREARTFLENLS